MNILRSGLTPAPELALDGDEQAVGGAGPGEHAADRHVVQAAVAVRTPQVLAQVAVRNCKRLATEHVNMSFSKVIIHLYIL